MTCYCHSPQCTPVVSHHQCQSLPLTMLLFLPSLFLSPTTALIATTTVKVRGRTTSPPSVAFLPSTVLLLHLFFFLFPHDCSSPSCITTTTPLPYTITISSPSLPISFLPQWLSYCSPSLLCLSSEVEREIWSKKGRVIVGLLFSFLLFLFPPTVLTSATLICHFWSSFSTNQK